MYGVFNPVTDRYLITNTLSVCLMYRPESNGRIAAIETHQVLMLPYLFYCLFVIFCRSDSGFQLLICSWDGTVAYADFTAEEVGRPMSEEEKVCPAFVLSEFMNTIP